MLGSIPQLAIAMMDNSRTCQLVDAASNRVVCFCGYFETSRANEYQNANK